MRHKPTSASVTTSPCKCGFLERAAADPEFPIVFDSDMNEFHIQFGSDPSSIAIMIYHCFFCGGTAPKSVREKMFARIPVKEKWRLRTLTRKISSLEDARRLLGAPDNDTDVIVDNPEKKKQRSFTRGFRRYVYTNLSDTADIDITESRNGRVTISFMGKYIGPQVHKKANQV